MSTPNKRHQLINTLATVTNERRLRWEETADKDSFRAIFQSGMVCVEKAAYSNVDRSFRLIIFNKDGDEVDRIREVEPTSEQEPTLWELARQSALNSEAVIKSILEELQHESLVGSQA